VIRLKKMIAQCKLLPYFIKSIYVVTLEIKSNPSENKIFLLFVILYYYISITFHYIK